MLQFTYAHQPRSMHVAWLCVLSFHAAVLHALLLSAPQMDNNEKSITMEMVLAPVSNTPEPKPQKTNQNPVAPNAPVTQPHTASATSDALPATTSAASTGHTQAAPAFSLPSSEAQGLNNPKPSYPKLSRRLNEQGQVLIRVYVATDGNAQQAEIKNSSGYDRLDQEALRTVMRWRFVPGQRLGVPEAMWLNVPVNFVLE